MRVGAFVVRIMNVCLEIMSALLLVASIITFGVYFDANCDGQVVLGCIVGFLVACIVIVVFFGVAFLFLEMNNNLIAIKSGIDKLNSQKEE